MSINDETYSELVDVCEELQMELDKIVHCKECKYGMPCNDGEYYCEKGIGTFDTLVHEPDWFCGDGDRLDKTD